MTDKTGIDAVAPEGSAEPGDLGIADCTVLVEGGQEMRVLHLYIALPDDTPEQARHAFIPLDMAANLAKDILARVARMSPAKGNA